jgi:hypothetical protein
MPIYLVRWPDLSAALVKAGSEEELVLVLDEVGNAEGCTWSVYRGPLFIELSLPARFDLKEGAGQAGPVRPEDIVVDDVSALLEGAQPQVALAAGDTGADMSDAIERKAFPHVFRARHSRRAGATEDQLREAVAKELQALVHASWRREQVQRRDDLVSKVAAEMDAPVSLVRRLLESARREPDPPAPDGDNGAGP